MPGAPASRAIPWPLELAEQNVSIGSEDSQLSEEAFTNFPSHKQK